MKLSNGLENILMQSFKKSDTVANTCIWPYVERINDQIGELSRKAFSYEDEAIITAKKNAVSNLAFIANSGYNLSLTGAGPVFISAALVSYVASSVFSSSSLTKLLISAGVGVVGIVSFNYFTNEKISKTLPMLEDYAKLAESIDKTSAYREIELVMNFELYRRTKNDSVRKGQKSLFENGRLTLPG